MTTIDIDGSHGEGGGSILRLAAAYAVAFKKTIRVDRIRAGRDKPGLRPQHLVGLQALAKASGGTLEGGTVGSTCITFTPGTIEPSRIDVDIGTAGSIGLVYQVLSIACTSTRGQGGGGGPVEVAIRGGATYGKWAPSTAYIAGVIAPLLARMGIDSSIEVHRHGFFPRGGASATLRFDPVPAIRGLVLDGRGTITSIGGESLASQQLEGARVASRQASAFTAAVAPVAAPVVDIDTRHVPAVNPGSGITAWARTSTGCIIGSGSFVGDKGVSSERVGQACAGALLDALVQHPLATVDEHASDQLLPFVLLSREASRFVAPAVTSHARTNLDVARLFTSRPCTIREVDGHAVFDLPAVD